MPSNNHQRTSVDEPCNLLRKLPLQLAGTLIHIRVVLITPTSNKTDHCTSSACYSEGGAVDPPPNKLAKYLVVPHAVGPDQIHVSHEV